MYADTIEGFSKVADKKLAALKRSPGGFFVASMLAGAYVGLGIILIFTLGSQVPAEAQKLVMGATFGIALTLVVIAGAELFTSHTMFMAIRGFAGQGTLGDIGASWGMTWVGNLAGALVLVALFAAVIFCCLLAFIASGFEHSVANMPLLGLTLAGNLPESVSFAGFAWNLGWVTLGNAIGGAIVVGGAYCVSLAADRQATCTSMKRCTSSNPPHPGAPSAAAAAAR